MRVLLVHALPLGHRGGAELSLRQHVEAAPAGVTVQSILPDESVDLDAFDVVILGNLRPTAAPVAGFAGRVRRRIYELVDRSVLRSLAVQSEVAWARLWQRRLKGYRGYVIKSERDVHPCRYRDGRCVATTPLRSVPCNCTKIVTRTFERLYNLCDAVQFLSPLHRQAINQIVRIGVPQYEIAPPLDFARFRIKVPWERRKRAALITGDEIRIAPAAFQLAAECGYPAENLAYLSLPYERMPDLLNQYQAVVVAPMMLHAFGRIAAEAMACGCRVLANDRVGAMSWRDPLQACRESNSLFWQMVRNVPAEKNPSRAGNGGTTVYPGKQ